MKCGVIIPVGPGHEALCNRAIASVQRAVTFSKGAFSEVFILKGDDTEGRYGKSKTRNDLVKSASAEGCEYVFFLDADDEIFLNAFARVSNHINDDADAVWGAITDRGGVGYYEPREGQDQFDLTYESLLTVNPAVCLQIGHFVKTEIALKHPFDEAMNCGHDFKYYLEILHPGNKYKWYKLTTPLFLNNRGEHSGGPRKTTGRDWRRAVDQLQRRARGEYALEGAQ